MKSFALRGRGPKGPRRITGVRDPLLLDYIPPSDNQTGNHKADDNQLIRRQRLQPYKSQQILKGPSYRGYQIQKQLGVVGYALPAIFGSSSPLA
jgi:hypothetical protein